MSQFPFHAFWNIFIYNSKNFQQFYGFELTMKNAVATARTKQLENHLQMKQENRKPLYKENMIVPYATILLTSPAARFSTTDFLMLQNQIANIFP